MPWEGRAILSTPVADFDSPWKEALEEYLADCFALLFPQIADEIDWEHAPEFLENELRQVMYDAELGPSRVDMLARVWLRDGRDVWILVHVEVQGQEDTRFAQRMFGYFYRLYDRYARPIVSLAVLTDERPSWRPSAFALEQWGCTMHFVYPVAKLTDWRGRQEELAVSDNPFAVFVLAHLAAQDTKRDVPERERAKLGLIRRLYDRGHSRQRIQSLFRFIDWLLLLPADREAALWQEIKSWEEERQVPYITSVERIGQAKGLEQGRVEGLEQGRAEGERDMVRRAVLKRFGAVPNDLEARIAEADRDELTMLFDKALAAAGIDEI